MKKNITILLVLLIVIGGLVFFFTRDKGIKYNTITQEEKVDQSKLDKEAYQKAIGAKDASLCQSVKNRSLHNLCIKKTAE